MGREKDTSEDVRVAYQSAVAMITYEGQLTWQVTSVFMQFSAGLVAVSVLPNFIGEATPLILYIVALVLSAAGCVASVMWASMIFRNRRYYQYWLFTAAELEAKMAEPVKTFSVGYDFSSGEAIRFSNATHPDQAKKSRLRFIERVRMSSNLGILYATFLLVFLILTIVNLIRLFHTIFAPA
jgi:hypothetical protein